MIGSCNCPITANCPIALSDYNFANQLEKNTVVYVPIRFDEIFIVMISSVVKKKTNHRVKYGLFISGVNTLQIEKGVSFHRNCNAVSVRSMTI